MKLPYSPELAEAFNPNNGSAARFVEWSVRFEVVQDEIYESLIPSATENPEISRLAQTIDKNTDLLDIVTFELDSFPLDGVKVIPPRRTELPEAQIGLFMNLLSDESGYFFAPQVYTATAAYAYDLIAITLDWGFAPAVDFTVEWYNGNTLQYSENISGNDRRICLVDHAVADVDKVVITVTRALPHHFVRLAEFIPGAILMYDRSNSDTLTIEEVADPLAERAPAGTLRLMADNVAEQFDIFDPAGIYLYFKERMAMYPAISARSPDDVLRRVDMGKYYLQAPQLKGNLSKLQLDATNLIGTLQDTQYTKSIYKTATLAQFAEDVAADAGVVISYPASLSSVSVTGYIPSMSHAQAFADIARASNTVLRVLTDDTLEFCIVDSAVDVTVGMDDYRTGDGISPSDDTIYNTVELEAQAYTPGEPVQLAQVPAMGEIVSSAFYVDNAVVITSAGTYYPKYSPAVNASAAIIDGSLIITGQPINSTARVISATARRENEKPYVYSAAPSPLIQGANAQAVAEYTLKRKADKRRIVKINYRGYPYLDIADTVNFNTGGNDTQPFFLTKNRFTLGGGMTGVMEAREV